MATAASPVTLVAVRHMSRMRSTPKISAMPAGGTPIASSTMTSITMPALGTAAVPMDASSAVKTMVACAPRSSGMPSVCAMKTAATDMYTAVPSMLMVAPSGSANEATSSETPRSCSAVSMVTGRVAALDEVEKATSCAGATPRRKRSGVTGVRNCSSAG